MAHNAAAAMKKVARDHAEMQTYTPDEIGKVLRAGDADRNGDRDRFRVEVDV